MLFRSPVSPLPEHLLELPALAGKQDGLRQPNSSINTPTPKKIREKYTQINNLLHRYGALVKNDAKRIEKVAQNMRELDEKMGRR